MSRFQAIARACQRLKQVLAASSVRVLVMLTLIASVLVSPALASSAPAPVAQSSQVTLSGTLLTVWGDPAPGVNTAQTTTYSLVDDNGKQYELRFDPRLNERLVSLYTRRITLSGSLSQGPTTNGVSGDIVVVDTIQNVSSSPVQPDLVGQHRFLSIMCKFSDTTGTEPNNQAFF